MSDRNTARYSRMLLAGIQKKTRMPAFAHARQLKGSVRDLAGALELKLNHEEHEGGKKLEFDELSNRVIGCAIEVHRTLGPGLLESTY
ncbi:MAG TPA: GxxExxY protein, partial [Syntrophales bacterium]